MVDEPPTGADGLPGGGQFTELPGALEVPGALDVPAPPIFGVLGLTGVDGEPSVPDGDAPGEPGAAPPLI